MHFLQSSNFEFEENSKYEILSNMVSIAEQLKNKKINVSFHNGNRAQYSISSKGIYIKIGTDNGNVSPKTRLERILAGIIFDTSDDRFETYAKKIKTNTTIKQRQSFLHHIKIIYQNLEARRIESCYGDIYRGANDRFVDARQYDITKELRKIQSHEFSSQDNSTHNKDSNPKDPIEALILARYDQKELVQNSEFAVALDYIKGVELTGKDGAYKLAVMYWEKVVQPFLEKSLKKPQVNSDSDGTDFETDKQDKTSTATQLDSKIQMLEKELLYEKDSVKKSIVKMALKELKKQRSEEKIEGTLLEDFSESFRVYSGQKAEFENLCSDLKESGREEISQIEEEIERISKKDIQNKFGWSEIEGKIIEERAKSSNRVKFNKIVANNLKNSFKKIQGGKHTEIDSVGDEIDVESYIDFRVNHIGNFYKSTKQYPGFDIVIAIDESGSMSGEIAKVKRMCATLYEAISGIPNVRLTIIGWTGSRTHCRIKKITKASEIGSLEAAWGTPIDTAVWYSKHLIERFSSTKRLFILISDGQPNDKKDVEIARQGISLMRKKGIICNGICVGIDDDNFTLFMRQIFGKDFVVCDDYKHVDTFLTKKISSQIIKSLRKSNHN